jgi:hypothetical protein
LYEELLPYELVLIAGSDVRTEEKLKYGEVGAEPDEVGGIE